MQACITSNHRLRQHVPLRAQLVLVAGGVHVLVDTAMSTCSHLTLVHAGE